MIIEVCAPEFIKHKGFIKVISTTIQPFISEKANSTGNSQMCSENDSLPAGNKNKNVLKHKDQTWCSTHFLTWYLFTFYSDEMLSMSVYMGYVRLHVHC